MNAAPAMQQCRLQERHELILVPGEAARDIGGAKLQRHGDKIQRRVGVFRTLLALRALVGGRRELPLGEAVDAVVLDDIEHVDAAPDRMRELPEADRGGIAVARHAHIDEVAIGEIGAGQHRGHAPMHRVEPVRLAEEIGRRLGRTADARELGDAVRRQIELEARLHDRGADRDHGRTRRRASTTRPRNRAA